MSSMFRFWVPSLASLVRKLNVRGFAAVGCLSLAQQPCLGGDGTDYLDRLRSQVSATGFVKTGG
jgi:hypothetical protein